MQQITQVYDQDFSSKLQGVLKLPVSKVWRGYGATFFIEFGKVNSEGIGEFTIVVNKNWELISDQVNVSADTAHGFGEIDEALQMLSGLQFTDFILTTEKLVLMFESAKVEIQLRDDEAVWVVKRGSN